jgi:hypothetical protein
MSKTSATLTFWPPAHKTKHSMLSVGGLNPGLPQAIETDRRKY